MKYRPKNWLFEERNKVDEPLARLIKKKKRVQMTTKNGKESYNWYHRNTNNLKRLQSELYTNKMENLEQVEGKLSPE